MRRLKVLTPAFVLIAAIGGGTGKADNLSGPSSDSTRQSGEDSAPSR